MPPTLENTPAILFKGGVMFKSLALCGLVSAGTFAAVPANASTLGYEEWLYYDFTYFAPDHSIEVPTAYNGETPRAYFFGETSGYSAIVQFGFALIGLQTGRLTGKDLELTFAGLDSSFPDHVPNTFYLIDIDYDFYVKGGHVSFGKDDKIKKWSYSGYRDDGGAVSFSTSSDPSTLVLDEAVSDPENLNGSQIFDQYRFEPNDKYFSTRPGYWTTAISKYCFVSEDGSYVSDTECRAPAVVPLPASSPLLFGALCLLLGLYAMRGRPPTSI
jgi:hypothetical protein